MPVMRIDGRACTMQVFPLATLAQTASTWTLSWILLVVVATYLNVMALGYKRCDVCEKLIRIGEDYKYV